MDIMQYINVLCKTTNQIDFKKSIKLFYQCLSRKIQKAINNQNVNFDKTLMTVTSSILIKLRVGVIVLSTAGFAVEPLRAITVRKLILIEISTS